MAPCDPVVLDALVHRTTRHAFFTRRGGVSGGIYASRNCGFGSGDLPAHVAENRSRCLADLDGAADALVTVHQTHSATAVEVREPWKPGDAPKADAMVTDRPGIAVGVLAADCAPVLMADREAGVIGAAHAGWKGAIGGVLDQTVAAMAALGARPARIVAGVGPCIGAASYEVGPEFRDRFVALAADNERFFRIGRDDRLLFDLAGYVVARLDRLGLARIDRTHHDTVVDEALFFSYRRATRRGESDYGRCLSAIALTR